MFKANDKKTKTFTPFSTVSFVDCKQVNVSWAVHDDTKNKTSEIAKPPSSNLWQANKFTTDSFTKQDDIKTNKADNRTVNILLKENSFLWQYHRNYKCSFSKLQEIRIYVVLNSSKTDL